MCKEHMEALLAVAQASKVDLTPENITLLQQMLSLALEVPEDCPVTRKHTSLT
jgi:hypothetical protein